MAGEVEHPDATRVRRAVSELDELWRRSGGRLDGVSPEAIRLRLREQVETVNSWEDFHRTRVALDPAELVDEPTRQRLEALPAMVRVRGDASPVEYELQHGEGVARLRLREGQAKRLRADEVPALDRPVRFAVQRGRHPPILADTVPDLQALLRRAPQSEGRRASRHGRRPGRRR
jgi:ATP-dependent helicase HrpA